MIDQLCVLGRVARHVLTWRHAPSYLLFLVTARCNARCRMCYFWQEMEESSHREELTVDEVDRFSRSMGPLFQVQISGGEPFLRDDLVDVIRTLVRNLRPSILSIASNGSLETAVVATMKTLCEDLPMTAFRVVFSLDAIGKAHDALRSMPGLFDRLLSTFHALQDLARSYRNLSVHITTVFSRLNQDTILDTLRYVHDNLQPGHHTVMLVRGGPREPEASEVTVEQYEEVVAFQRKLLRRNRKKGIIGRLGSVLYDETTRLVAATQREHRQVIPCIGGQKQITINDQGVVLPCEILHSFLHTNPSERLASAEMGRIRDFEYSVPDLLRSEQARRVRQFVADKCCYCTSECLLPSSMMFCPAQYPRFMWAACRSLWA